jgi:tetratricopeptide (TPR) repeat protein
MLAYFQEMREAIEAYGGAVEKFIGDAVVGVFGVPVAHEDDALRAARAALDMQQRLAALNDDLERRFGTRLSIRIGINTGEVVAVDSVVREGLVFGDAVNVAARLEQAAAPGDVLLGETTFALVEQFVEVEELTPLSAKGKSAPLRAYRLLAVKAHADGRRRSVSPFVGRDAELATLVALFEGVSISRTPERVLVIGEAGVGKSRLVDAALERVGSAVSVLSLRCLPYGEDITYLPVIDLVRQVAGIGEDDDPLATQDRIREVFGGGPDTATATAILAQVLGLVEGAVSADEIAWAVRRFVEAVAATHALVLLVDDLQWAQEPFLELLAAVADRGRGPIVVLGLARPEFAVGRPDWPVGLRLSPLSDEESVELVRLLVPALESQERLLDAAGGNPLFLTELVAYVGAEGEGSEVPPTLDALLNARLDARPPHERRILECAAIEGQVFHEGALLALAGAEDASTVQSSIERLLEDALIRPSRSSFENEDAFQFHHLLVRDAAYRGTAKRRRADLHLRFAGWLETKLGMRVAEAAEIVGYHLEQVCRLRSELGPLDDETRDVGARAAALLSGAARRSLSRGDPVAARGLFVRAAALAPPGPARIEIELGRGSATSEVGEFALAEELLSAVERDAIDAGLDATAARARLELAMLEQSLRPHAGGSNLKPVAEAALATFAQCADEHGRAYALTVLARERWVALRCAEAEELLEEALVHAEAARDDRLTASILTALARAILVGPTPADKAARRCEQLLARARLIGPATEAAIRNRLGVLEAMRGRAEHARELIETSIAVLEETALPVPVAGASQYAGMAELALGDPARAERYLRSAFETLDRLGERSVASSTAALLSRALVDLSRHDEAERLASLAIEWSGDGVVGQAYAQSALALVSVARDDPAEARRLASSAVELSAATDFSNLRGDTLLDLAVVLRANGDEPGAERTAADARACYLAKGNRAAAARVAVLAPG